MSWDKLPVELRLLIFAKVHEIFEENSNIIQKYWHKFTNPRKVALELWMKMDVDPNEPSSLILPETARLIKFTSKVVSFSGKENFESIRRWNLVIGLIGKSLWEDEHVGGPSAIIYNEIEKYYSKVAKKFRKPTEMWLFALRLNDNDIRDRNITF
tara:strand:+ start:1325 stop:1789 length:465 start_codon:yes stop_codon:yes gene_type:complete